MKRQGLTGLLAGARARSCWPRRPAGLGAGADDLLGGVGSGQLPAGARQRVHRGDRRRRSRSRPRPGRTSRPRPSPSSTPRATPTTWWSATRQWLGAGSTGGHYVDLTDFFKEHKRRRDHGAGDGRRPTPSTTASTGRSRPRATRPAGPIARTGSRTRPRWRPSRPSTATTSRVPKTWTQLRDIAEFFHRPDENRYGIAHLHRQLPTTRWSWASRTRCSPTAAISATTRPARSRASSTPTRRWRRSRCTASSTASRRRTGARPSSRRTTRRSPRAWRR